MKLLNKSPLFFFSGVFNVDSHGVLLGPATRTNGETPGGFIFIGTQI